MSKLVLIVSRVVTAIAITTAAAAPPPIPLNELTNGRYDGIPGGLYADGQNQPHGAHAEALRARCAQIVPLDADGKPSPRGKIVIAGVGASVCRQIFDELEKSGAKTEGIHSAVQFVNCAVGGADVNKIADDRYWAKVEDALKQQDVTAAQVQVIWYQSDDLRDSRADFPGRPERLQKSLAEQMQLIGKHFPQARLCYHSARHTTAFQSADKSASKHSEPRPYHVGWAVKWLVESPQNGQAGPLATWSTYFWTNGDQQRADGYRWTPEMVVADGVHLSDAGRERVARELCDFWSHDPFAKTWFLAKGAASAAPPSAPAANANVKPQIAAAQALQAGDPALLINGKSKFAKLGRLLNTDKPVRLVAYDVKDNKVLLSVDDVFHQRLDLNEKLGPGEYRLQFLGADGKRLPMTMEVPDVVKIK
jgi:hypothetical protein